MTISSSSACFEDYEYRLYEGSYYRGCSRCGGTGHHSFNGYDTICYKCGNTMDKLGVFIGTEEDARKDAARRAKARAARVAAKEKARLVLVAQQDAKVAAAKAEYPEIVEFLLALDIYEERNSFLVSMAENLQFVSNHAKPFTTKMAEAVQKILEAKAAKALTSAANPVTEGRQTITGVIKSAKTVETDFGVAYKITVEDDHGFRVYGSLAKALVDAAYDAFYANVGEDRTEGWLAGVVGRRLTFSAAVIASDDDVAFGFYSRPTKAAWVA